MSSNAVGDISLSVEQGAKRLPTIPNRRIAIFSTVANGILLIVVIILVIVLLVGNKVNSRAITDLTEEIRRQFDALKPYDSNENSQKKSLGAINLEYITLDQINRYDTFLFDIDGVLLEGYDPIPGAADFVNHLIQANKTVLIISNNDWKLPTDRAKEFRKESGIQLADTSENFVLPMVVLVDYLKSKGGYENSRVLSFSPPAVSEFLAAELNITTIPFEPYFDEDLDFDKIKDQVDKIKPKAILMDSYSGYSQTSIAVAANILRTQSVDFFALSGDEKFKGPYDLIFPDGGGFRDIVEFLSHRTSEHFGKPSSHLNDYLEKKFHLSQKKAVLFGDSLTTDILTANSLKIDSVFMLTGVSTLADIEKAADNGNSAHIPSYKGDFAQLLKDISNNKA